VAQKFSSYSAATILGISTISILVPGTFVSLNPSASGFSGREMLNMQAWFQSQASGDFLSALYANDTNGVIPSGQRGPFSNYPNIGSLFDSTVPLGSQQSFLPPGGRALSIPFTNSTNHTLASGIFLVAVLTKANLTLSDTAYLNLAWDDFT
jgi:hypothetical protein